MKITFIWVTIAITVAFFGCAHSPSRTNISINLEGYWQLDGDGADASPGARPLELEGSPKFEPGLFGDAITIMGVCT